MVQSQLSAYSGSDPIWGFVALVRSELFTGEAAVGLDPRVRLFAVEGYVYFAEREDDAPVGTRLVNCGAVSANQLARGAVQAGGHQSLARLFQRDATIDRDAVELTIAASTESLLASIAANPVGMPEVFPLRHHSAGLHHWLRAVPTIAADEVPPADAAVEEETVAEVAEPVFGPEAIVVPEPVVLPEAIVVPEPVVPPQAIVVPEPVVPSEAIVPEPIVVAPEPVASTPSLPLLRTSFTSATPAERIVVPEPTAAERVEAFPAPQVPAEAAAPASPRVDDEPVWAVPADARELTPLLEPPVVAEVQALAMLEVPNTEAELPRLASLNSIQIPPTGPTPRFHPMPATSTDEALPKLAANPMSVSDIKKDLKKAATASEPWTGAGKNMAAVQIWEMVDDMFDDGTKQDPRVGTAAPQVRTRGWLRKKG